MNRWTQFLNSLATAGGNLGLLYLLVAVLIGVDVGLILKYGASLPPAVAELSSLAKDGFIALIAILSGRNTPQPPAGGGTNISTNSPNIEVKAA